MLVIDDTAIPKKGAHSVGVAAQYASALGKTANCQTLVSLTLARGEVPVMLALRLFLPESWTSKRARLERAGVPTDYRTARTKPEMALAEIDRVIAAGVRFGYVLADAGYGISAAFRQGLTARALAWAVGIPRHLKVYPADVRMIWPVAGRGRPRKRHVPDILSIAAEDMLADATWQNISWRTGTKGKLKARFAAIRVRIADGPPQRIRDKGQQHLPGEEAWLIGEHRVLLGPHGPMIVGIGSLIHVLTIVVVWSLGRAQGLAFPLSDAAVLLIVMVGVTLVPISIGGWGLRELAVVSLLGNHGVPPEKALLFSVCFGLTLAIGSLPGALAWLVYSFRPARPSPDHGG